MSDKKIEDNLEKIEQQMQAAADAANRKLSDIKLLAVTKGQPVSLINEYIALQNSRGKKALLGENYLQEYLQKKDQLLGDFKLHYIGRVQSNKIKLLVANFSVIESVSSLDHLNKINQQAALQKCVAGIFIQVNISKDPNKAGVLIEEVEELFCAAEKLENLSPAGLMTILEDQQSREEILRDYRQLSALRLLLQKNFQQKGLPHCALQLSMGMSADFDLAIAAGADQIRVGSALFGSRTKG